MYSNLILTYVYFPGLHISIYVQGWIQSSCVIFQYRATFILININLKCIREKLYWIGLIIRTEKLLMVQLIGSG